MELYVYNKYNNIKTLTNVVYLCSHFLENILFTLPKVSNITVVIFVV